MKTWISKKEQKKHETAFIKQTVHQPPGRRQEARVNAAKAAYATS